MVAQLLFLSGRACHYIQTAVAFLTTQVKAQDEDNWEELRKMLKYLHGIIGLKLSLAVEDADLILCYVNASYAIHSDCKEYMGAMMMLGQGVVMKFSRKQ